MLELEEVIASVSMEAQGALQQLDESQGLSASALSDEGQCSFRIRLADSFLRQDEVSELVNRRYSARGLARQPKPQEQAMRGMGLQPAPQVKVDASRGDSVTLMASNPSGFAIGTLMLGLDAPEGRLLCDEAYFDVVAGYRGRGERLCEMGKFALECDKDQRALSMYVMGALMHVAYIFARHLHGCDRLLIEVNPRHAAFYQRSIGFAPAGPERICPRANAPAVLLQVDLSHIERQLALHGGTGPTDRTRTIYPYCFSPAEEVGIVARLRRALSAVAQPPKVLEEVLN